MPARLTPLTPRLLSLLPNTPRPFFDSPHTPTPDPGPIAALILAVYTNPLITFSEYTEASRGIFATKCGYVFVGRSFTQSHNISPFDSLNEIYSTGRDREHIFDRRPAFRRVIATKDVYGEVGASLVGQ